MPFRRDDDERHTFLVHALPSLSVSHAESVDREPYITISFYITMPLHASVDEEALDRASRSTERPHICGDGTAISQSDFVNEPSEGVQYTREYRTTGTGFPPQSARALARAHADRNRCARAPPSWRQTPRRALLPSAARARHASPAVKRCGARCAATLPVEEVDDGKRRDTYITLYICMDTYNSCSTNILFSREETRIWTRRRTI